MSGIKINIMPVLDRSYVQPIYFTYDLNIAFLYENNNKKGIFCSGFGIENLLN